MYASSMGEFISVVFCSPKNTLAIILVESEAVFLDCWDHLSGVLSEGDKRDSKHD